MDLDIAEKLLVGGDFIVFPMLKEIRQNKSLVLTKEQILNRVKKETKNNNIVYFGTILGRDSTGVFIRVTIEELTPGYKLKIIVAPSETLLCLINGLKTLVEVSGVISFLKE